MDGDGSADAATGALPTILPVFPLPGVLLLPDGVLPLNIFEPRYLAMTEDALGAGRLIGMIQPCAGEESAPVPDLSRTGCAGRIVQFSETGDGRYLITLAGLIRFDVGHEVETRRGYRRVAARWTRWQADLESDDGEDVDRERLMSAVRGYFVRRGIEPDWKSLEQAGDSRLLAAIGMSCPFAPHEKQALLETPTLGERARLTVALLEMALHESDAGGSDVRH